MERLADPERAVGRELEPATPVELLDRADQSKHALLDQVLHRETAAGDPIDANGPVGLAIDGDHLYWTTDGAIGRARLDGKHGHRSGSCWLGGAVKLVTCWVGASESARGSMSC
jgi:hypothetical protein